MLTLALPKPSLHRTLREPPRESFNLMVVGEAGLGKTTLLESFFKSFKDDEAAFALFERKETATEIETRKQLSEAQASKSKADRAKELKRLQNMKTGGTRPELAAWVNKRKKILAKMEL